MLCDDLEWWDWGDGMEVQEGGDICTHISLLTKIYDSLCCTAEANKHCKAIV